MSPGLTRLAWGTLAFNVAVILMGATVRATGSGAGCGRSWPTCQGQVVPALEGATAVEFTHRGLSGIALVLVAILAISVFKTLPAPNQARTAALWSLGAIVVEALIGAVIVSYEWVADDASLARAVSVPLHLVNTFLLLAALTLVAHLVSGGPEIRASAHPRTRRWLAAGAGAFIVIAATGAVTALADTLFPLSDGSQVEHLLTDLRVVHPVVALGVTLGAALALVRRGISGQPLRVVTALVTIQMLSGVALIVLQLPLWLRLAHLALADALWVAYILAAANLLAAEELAAVS